MAVARLLTLVLGAVALARAQSITNSGAKACVTLSAMSEVCSEATDDFEDYAFKTQASCLCYGTLHEA